MSTKSASLFRSRITGIWCLLIVATFASWALGHGLGFSDKRHAGIALLVTAFIKIRFVLLDFMELRHAPQAMRWGVEAWALTVCVALCAIHAG